MKQAGDVCLQDSRSQGMQEEATVGGFHITRAALEVGMDRGICLENWTLVSFMVT